MLNLRSVHEYARVPGTTEVRLTKTTPYVRLCVGDGPPLFVQGGVIYSEGGQVVTDLPSWFWTEAAKVSPQIRREVGLKLPHDEGVGSERERSPVKAAAKSADPSRVYTCEVEGCGQSVPMKLKGVHIAKHRRQVSVAAAV